MAFHFLNTDENFLGAITTAEPLFREMKSLRSDPLKKGGTPPVSRRKAEIEPKEEQRVILTNRKNITPFLITTRVLLYAKLSRTPTYYIQRLRECERHITSFKTIYVFIMIVHLN